MNIVNTQFSSSDGDVKSVENIHSLVILCQLNKGMLLIPI